eukprot:TRINITY_DN40788_c0_g1_i1.p1 TRINITY_DN40788_c0_g1~~TRINITY_DN40788_c0_g1_i1.p1  ORF type:complete len:553 (-),score=69.30 TRINITY_DN40788_c0_g1_i1:45-1703(-)
MFFCSASLKTAVVTVLYCLVSAGNFLIIVCARSVRDDLRFPRVPSWRRYAPEFRNALNALFEERRVFEDTRFRRIAMCCLLILDVQIIINNMTCSSRFMSFEQDLVVLFAGILMGMSIIYEHSGTNFFEGMCFDFLMLCLTLLNAPLIGTVNAMHRMRNLSIMFRLYSSTVSLSVPKTIFWNCANLCAIFACVILATDDALSAEEVRALAVQESAFMIVIIASVVTCVAATSDAVVQELDAKAAKKTQLASQALLDVVFDVVVCLDSDLQITEQAAKRVTALHANPQRSLEGVAFKSLLCFEEEQDRFERILRASLDTDVTRSEVFHATMCNGGGDSVRMELFAVTYKDVFDKCRHIIGLREIIDVDQSVQPLSLPARDDAQPINECEFTAIDNTALMIGSVPRCGDIAHADSGNVVCSSTLPSEQSTFVAVGQAHSRDIRRRVGRLLLDEYKETNPTAQRDSLANVLHSWNNYIQPQDCCPFHAMTQNIESALKTFQREPCQRSFKPAYTYQCCFCGILSGESFTNDTCAACLLSCESLQQWQAHGGHLRL